MTDNHEIEMILTKREVEVIQAIHQEGGQLFKQEDLITPLTKSFGWGEFGKKVIECPSTMHDSLIDLFCHTCKGTKTVNKLKRNRERAECEVKLKELGLEIPWKEFRPAIT